jgi:hypothetical protein
MNILENSVSPPPPVIIWGKISKGDEKKGKCERKRRINRKFRGYRSLKGKINGKRAEIHPKRVDVSARCEKGETISGGRGVL